MAEKFVFSTKKIGKDCLFSFGKLLSQKKNNKLWQLLQKKYISEKLVTDVSSALKEKCGVDLQSELINKYNDNTSIRNERLENTEEWVGYVSHNTNLGIGFLEIVEKYKDELSEVEYDDNTKIGDILKRFFCYTIENGEESNNDVYAIHCCWTPPSENWVDALIEDAIGSVPLNDNDQENTLYLLLHDKDLRNYDGRSFYILTQDEINKIKNKTDWNIKIIVFNHVSGGNAVIKLLEQAPCSQKSEELAAAIKSIFNNKEKIEECFRIVYSETTCTVERKKTCEQFPQCFSECCGACTVGKKEPCEQLRLLDPDSFVDLSNITIPSPLQLIEVKTNGTQICYEYTDNGALLTELTHIKTDIRASKQFIAFVKAISAEIDNKFPIIIRLYTSFFDDWAKAVSSDEDIEKILNHPNKKALEKNLKQVFSFFNNSSIWIRLVDINDNKAYNEAVAEFEYFKSIGLYDYGSAKENWEYNLRLFKENYLVSSSGGHGNYVTPVLYGDEVWARNFLKKNNVTLTLDDEQIKNAKVTLLKNLDSLNTNEESDEIKNAKKILKENKTKAQCQNDLELKHLPFFHDIALRILLIDDKVGDCSGSKEYIKISNFDSSARKIEIIECQECNIKECKLKAIKSLMNDGSSGDEKKSIFDQIGEKDENNVLKKDFFYWKESGIKTYYCPTIIEDFIDNDDNTLDFSKYSDIKVYSDSEQKLSNKPNDEENKPKTLEVECHFEPKIKKNDLHVQIVGVRDVRTALLLLSKYKFDMVFSDYLLDYKDSNRNEREYANQLFTFLAHDYKADKEKSRLEKKEQRTTEENERLDFLKKHEKKFKVLDKLRHDVLDNRGPLGQMWIMPITGFNQTFIQDIYRDGTNLIDYKWNISNGADPITTPWQFLYHLNKFIELQLCLSVFRMKQLLQFLKYTCEDLEDLNKAQNDELCFDDFKSFMGSEYATYIQLYGNKLPIKRDALIKGGADNYSDSKSVFATYVWNKFYSSKETYNSVELCRLMHRFYFLASYMYNDRVGVQRLNEAFANLLFFVKTNRRVEAVIKENEGKLGGLREKLAVLRESISKCTNNQQEKNN